MKREMDIVEQAVKQAAAGAPAGGVQQIQMEPVRLMFVASDPGAVGLGITPDGRKMIRVLHFPFEVTVLLSDEVKRALITGLSGVEVPRGRS